MERRIDQACKRAGRLPRGVTIMAIAKGFPASYVQEAFSAGVRNFGENRVQEARAKMRELADLNPRIVWHMVGRLQSNKVKTAIEIFDIIHSVNSYSLAEAISARTPFTMPVLVEVNVSGEATKAGFALNETRAAVEQISHLRCMDVKGLMTIAPEVPDPEEVRSLFRQLHSLVQSLGLPHLSMGMSADFEVAVEEGATMVRIGRAIFGERPMNRSRP